MQKRLFWVLGSPIGELSETAVFGSLASTPRSCWVNAQQVMCSDMTPAERNAWRERVQADGITAIPVDLIRRQPIVADGRINSFMMHPGAIREGRNAFLQYYQPGSPEELRNRINAIKFLLAELEKAL